MDARASLARRASFSARWTLTRWIFGRAPGGPGKGAGIASFGGATAPADGAAYDIGAFDFGLVTLCP